MFNFQRVAYLVLFLTLLLTASFSYFSYRSIVTEGERRFAAEISQSKEDIADRLGTYIIVLKQTKAFFAANPVVSREQFRAYIERIDILQEYPGIQGIGFAQRIKAQDLQAHLDEVRESGYPRYRVWPEGSRDEYFSIVYLEPFDWRNRRAFGYDMFSHPVRRAAMEAARDSRRAVMSGKVTLVQETETHRQPGFLIYVPYYRPDMPIRTLDERRRALAGFVYSPFRAHDLLSEALARRANDRRHIRLEIYDGTAAKPEALLYSKPSERQNMMPAGTFRHETEVNVADRSWTLVAHADIGYLPPEGFVAPLLILVFGSLLSAMLFRMFMVEQARFTAAEQSREQIVSILESIGEAFASVDRGWRFRYVNHAAARVLNRNAADLIGKNLWQEYPFAVGTRIQHAYELAIRERRSVELEEFIPALKLWLNIRAYPSKDGLSIYFRDVSEEKRNADALRAERERLAVTLYSIADGVITTDTDGNVALINQAAQELTGWTQDEVVGKPLNEVLVVVDRGTHTPIANPAVTILERRTVLQPGKDLLLSTKDARERVIQLSGSPIAGADNTLLGTVVVFRDVTQQIENEREAIKARNLEAIGVLAGGIAHDFNNILTAILGNISLARLQVDSDNPGSSILEDAEKACLRASELTQQLLTFAKGGMPVKKAASIAEVLQQTAVFALRGSPVRVEFAIARDLWLAEFDAGQISQVINNLVINAQQAMPGGGTVCIAAENAALSDGEAPSGARGDYLRIIVADHGVGIPEENRARIFDPYFSTKRQGAGLGLATAYSIIRRHAGHITVDSAPGAGTRVTLYLPAVRGRAVEQDDTAQRRVAPGRGRVLVMDDEEAVRAVAARLLEAAGYNPVVAKDGEEALMHYARAMKAGRRFEAVILDLTVPGGMGGKECVARLRRLDPTVTAIVATGYSTDPVMADHRAFGFSARIAKPFEVAELSQVLAAVLRVRIARPA